MGAPLRAARADLDRGRLPPLHGRGRRSVLDEALFGLALRSHGWRILFLGADTPIATLAKAATAMKPQLVVVTSTDGTLLDSVSAELRRLGRSARLVLSGAGASEELCARLRIDRLDRDLVAAAETVARA